MHENNILQSYIHLCDIIDNKTSYNDSLAELTSWIKNHFRVSAVCLFRKKNLRNGERSLFLETCSDSTLTEKLEKNSHLSSILYKTAEKFPSYTDIKRNTGTGTRVTEAATSINTNRELSDYLSSLTGRTVSTYFFPVTIGKENTIGALLFINDNPVEPTIEEEFFLKVLSLKIQSMFLAEAPFEDKHLAVFLKVAEDFELPVYAMDVKGRFLYLSFAFLSLLGFSNKIEFSAYGSVFVSSEERKKELNTILKNGNVKNYRLALKTKEGKTVTVHESAFLKNNMIICHVYNITEFVIQANELSESLEMQQFLNDRIFDTISLLQKTQVTAIKTLARLAEYRDQETGDHLQRIREYCKILSVEVFRRHPYSFKISQGYSNDMYLSSMLHDIGKVGVPDSILLKPGKLDSAEWTIMKNHTLWGWAILSEADKELGEQSFLTLAAIIALHHHERYDGTGYPKALKGENIPLSARIAAIADVYDALTSKRTYKDAWTHEKTIEELKKQRGKQFDPVLIDIFLDIEQQFFKIRNNFPD
ncbi:MAG: HD domain-containing protein [Spirochaetales bacterium]|nr:HD domain-containing protein [Spirochaetales bacterium]